MSLKLKTKFRIIQKGDKYYLQEKFFFKWRNAVTYSGLKKPYGFNSTKAIHELIRSEFWWDIIRTTRKFDYDLFIRQKNKNNKDQK